MIDRIRPKPKVLAGPARGSPAYLTGVADGDECRRSSGTISTLRLVAINDEYSAGFRAGYFQRG